MSRNYCIQSLKLIYLLIEGKEMTWVNVWACSHYEAIKKKRILFFNYGRLVNLHFISGLSGERVGFICIAVY